MVAKPDPSDVIELTDTDLSEGTVSGLIDDAALMVERCVADASEDRQKAIVKWVAAHLVVSGPDQMRTSEKLGDATDSFAIAKLGKALEGTVFGQQALALDVSGCLARIGRPQVTFKVL